MDRQLYILANSPGELSGWVAPVVEEVRSVLPDIRITIALIPDWFTSGREQQFAAKLPVDRVVGVFTLIREIWRRRNEFVSKQNLVLFMGGDALYAKGLSRLLKCPAMAYMPRVYYPADFARIFVPSPAEKDRAVRKGADPDRITVVPTLALDSVKPSGTPRQVRDRLALAAESQPVFSLLAGSRPEYANLGFNFMLEVANLLLAEYPEGYILLPVSPFIDKSIVLDVLRQRQMKWTEAQTCETLSTGDGRIRFVFGNTHDAFAVTDVALVIPGTNNLQCAAMGIPFIVLVPLNWIEHIRFEGLLGLLYPKFFPFNVLKKYVVTWVSGRILYASMVNRMAGRMLVTEVRAVVEPHHEAALVSELWRDVPRRTKLVSELLELTRERGAARIIAEGIRENFISDQRVR